MQGPVGCRFVPDTMRKELRVLICSPLPQITNVLFYISFFWFTAAALGGIYKFPLENKRLTVNTLKP